MCRRSRTTSDSSNIDIQSSPCKTYGQSWRDNSRHHKCSRATTLTHIEIITSYRDLQTCVLDFLPGLECPNYPSAIGPIVKNLPNFIHSKWEKRVQYAEDHRDAYPGFKEFAAIIQERARLKNHLNVLACTQSNTHEQRPQTTPSRHSQRGYWPKQEEYFSNQFWKTETWPKMDGKEEKFCAFHQRKGHLLMDCKAFKNEPLETKNDCILKAGLCFCCLSGGHRST